MDIIAGELAVVLTAAKKKAVGSTDSERFEVFLELLCEDFLKLAEMKEQSDENERFEEVSEVIRYYYFKLQKRGQRLVPEISLTVGTVLQSLAELWGCYHPKQRNAAEKAHWRRAKWFLSAELPPIKWSGEVVAEDIVHLVLECGLCIDSQSLLQLLVASDSTDLTFILSEPFADYFWESTGQLLVAMNSAIAKCVEWDMRQWDGFPFHTGFLKLKVPPPIWDMCLCNALKNAVTKATFDHHFLHALFECGDVIPTTQLVECVLPSETHADFQKYICNRKNGRLVTHLIAKHKHAAECRDALETVIGKDNFNLLIHAFEAAPIRLQTARKTGLI